MPDPDVEKAGLEVVDEDDDDDAESEYDEEAEAEKRHEAEEKKKAEKKRQEFIDTICVFIAFIIIIAGSIGELSDRQDFIGCHKSFSASRLFVTGEVCQVLMIQYCFQLLFQTDTLA